MINDKLLTAPKAINESDLPCPEELIIQATYTRTLVGERDESSATWETGYFCIGLEYKHPAGIPITSNGKVNLVETFTIYEDGTVKLDYSRVTVNIDSLIVPSVMFFSPSYIKITNNKTGVSLMHDRNHNYWYDADEDNMANSPGVLDINGGTVEFTVETDLS